MEEHHCLHVRARPNLPNQLQWSDDNNISITTQTAIHLLTPVHTGANPDRRITFLHAGLPSLSPTSHFQPSLEYDEENIQTSYALTEGYRCSSWSPTGVSKLSTCLLSIVTTSHRVLIYGPKAHPANSEWVQVKDITPCLAKLYTSDGNGHTFVSSDDLNKFQSMSISWSTKCPLSTSSPDLGDISVIALGSKAGTVTLWSYHRTSGSRHLTTFTAHVSWITNLAWSRWHPVESGCYAYLSTACVDGSVAFNKVSIMLDASSSAEVVTVEPHTTWFQQDRQMITAIKWFDEAILDVKDGSRYYFLCAVTKITTVYVFSVPSSATEQGDGDLNSIILVDYTLPIGMGVSGLSWSADGRLLRLFAVEGRHRTVIVSFAKAGTPTLLCDDELSTTFIARQMSSTFKRQEAEENRKGVYDAEDDDVDDVGEGDGGGGVKEPRIWGADASPGGIYMAFVYSLASSFDMEYKTEKFDTSYLDLCPTQPRGEEALENALIERLRCKLADPDLFFHNNATFLLWDLLEYMEFDTSAGPAHLRLFNRLLSVLQEIYNNGQSTIMPASAETSASKTMTISSFRRMLYSHCGINAARLILHLDQNLKHIDLPPEARATLRATCDTLQLDLLEYYTRCVLSFTHAHTIDEFRNMDTSSLTLLLLFCDHALLVYPHKSQLLSLVKATYARLAEHCAGAPGAQGVFINLEREKACISDMIATRRPIAGEKNMLPPREKCPACGAGVPLASAAAAVCANGHLWQRCAITMRVVPIPRVRACVGCNRKAWMDGEQGGRSLIDEIVMGCDKCVYCANNFAGGF